MTQTHKNLILLGAIGIGLLWLTAWSYATLAASHEAAVAATDDRAVCQRLTSGIQQLRQGRSASGSQPQQLNELVRHLERAAASAQIPIASLMRIWPQPDRRVGKSTYVQKATQVLLHSVTLKQIVTFLHAATGADQGLRVGDVRLTAPQGSDSGSAWNAEITVAYLVDAP